MSRAPTAPRYSASTSRDLAADSPATGREPWQIDAVSPFKVLGSPPARTLEPDDAVFGADAESSSGVGRFQRYGLLALVLFLLATSKWGSYLPIGHPPYIADIVLVALIAGRVTSAAVRGTARARTRAMKLDSALTAALVVLLGLTVVTLVFGRITQDALRDAAPYVYALAAFLVWPLPKTSEVAVSRAITGALLFHQVWVTVAQVAPSAVAGMPVVGGIQLLSLRTDFDSLVCGLFAAISLHRALSGRSVFFNLAMAGWGIGMVLALISRAGLLALVAMILVVMLLGSKRSGVGRRSERLLATALVALSIPIVILLLGQSQSVQRLEGLGGGSGASTELQAMGAGTARARSSSWSILIHYLEGTPGRAILGVGFGPDFLQDSGADLALLGGHNQDVRSPHNYLLNTWARLGIIGLALAITIIAIGLRLAMLVVRSVRQLADHELLAVLIVVGMPIAAVLGVVLESPFGAIPYFWALGFLALRARELGTMESPPMKSPPITEPTGAFPLMP